MKLNGLLVSVVFLAGSITVFGQNVVYDSGNTTNASGVFDIGENSVWVGYTNANNGLIFEEDSSLKANQFTIGGESGSTNNFVVLEENAQLNLGGSLVVGFRGNHNLLELEGGASVNKDESINEQDLYIGLEEGASSNRVMIGGGDVSFRYVVVGNGGSSNSLVITDGGTLKATDGYIGYNTSATGNLMHVSGDQTTADFSGTLFVGNPDNMGNHVVVTNGGLIVVSALEFGGTNNWFDLDDGGTLTVMSDFDASTNGFNWNEGGALNVGGVLTGVNGSIESNRTLGVFGTWDQSTTNLIVGGSTSSNSLNIYNGGLVTADRLTIGGLGPTNNAVMVYDGGKLVLNEAPEILLNNSLTITNGGWLTISNSFDASVAGFNFAEGGILELTGALTGMTNVLDGSRSVRLVGGTWSAGDLTLGQTDSGNTIYASDFALFETGNTVLGAEVGSDHNEIIVDGAIWNSAGAITVGSNGSFNAVSLTGGAQAVSVTDVTIGVSGSSNTLYVGGSGSELTASGDINIGGSGTYNRLFIENDAQVNSGSGIISGSGNSAWIRGAGSAWITTGDVEVNGAGNSLHITEGGGLNAGLELSVRNGANLVFESGGSAFAASYYQENGTRVLFDSVTNVPLVTAFSGTGAEIEAGAAFEFTGEINQLTRSVTNSQLLVGSDALTVNGNLNPTTNDLATLIGASTDDNNLYYISFMAENDDLFMQIYRESLAISAGFDSNEQMYAVSEDIDDIADQGNQNAINQLNILGQLSKGADGQQNAQLRQLYERSAPTYMHMEGLLEGMRQVQNRGIVPDDYWPVGVYGPHFPGEQAQLWFKGFGSWGSQSDDGDYSGYDQSVYGVVIGYDKAFKDLLVGLAGGYSQSNIDQDDGDTSDSGIGYGILYGSYGSKDWFADASLAYGMGSVENETGTSFDTKSDIDASQFGFYLGGGKEFVSRLDSLFITPTLAISGGNWMQDSYKEKSSNSVVKNVEEYNRWSFKSELGVESVFRKELSNSILMPELRAKWLHEFNTDEDSLGYTLQGGTGNYSFGMMSPVSDLIELGAGLSWWLENKQGTVYEYAIGYDARFGSGYMANILNARVNIEF